MTGDVLSFISDLFYGPFFSMAEWVWNWIMGLCTGIITQMRFLLVGAERRRMYLPKKRLNMQ